MSEVDLPRLTEERLAEIKANLSEAAPHGNGDLGSAAARVVIEHDAPDLLAEVERLRWLCNRAADKLDEYWDEGPTGEGWQSDALKTLVRELKGETVTDTPSTSSRRT